MNTKIKKVIREIANTEQKIFECQEKLKQLNSEKIELENIEIIAMFRGYKVTTYDIENVMLRFKEYHESAIEKPRALPIIQEATNYEMEDINNEE